MTKRLARHVSAEVKGTLREARKRSQRRVTLSMPHPNKRHTHIAASLPRCPACSGHPQLPCCRNSGVFGLFLSEPLRSPGAPPASRLLVHITKPIGYSWSYMACSIGQIVSYFGATHRDPTSRLLAHLNSPTDAKDWLCRRSCADTPLKPIGHNWSYFDFTCRNRTNGPNLESHTGSSFHLTILEHPALLSIFQNQ
jgi:hypothetical protein